MNNEIYDRQVLAFGKAGQDILNTLTVAIIGVGGIGSIVFYLLLRLGVKTLLLIDNDIVETSNLNRLSGSTIADANLKMPKVNMHMIRGYHINPDIKVIPLQASILDNNAQQAIKQCDAVFGCTDNVSSRSVLNNLAAQYMIPYFDTGTDIKLKDNKIDNAGGQVRISIPGLGCLNCINGIDRDVAQQEMLPEEQRQIAIQRGYIQGKIPSPAVASLNGAIANLAVSEFMAYFTQCKPFYQYVYYDFLNAKTIAFNFSKNPNCFTCSPAGLLARGDRGKTFPENMIYNEEPQQLKPEILFQQKLLQTAKALGIEAQQNESSVILNNIQVSGLKTNIKILFNDFNPDIYMLDNSQENAWIQICIDVFQDINNPLDFLLCLIGYLNSPSMLNSLKPENVNI